jgi:hypothetical protein
MQKFQLAGCLSAGLLYAMTLKGAVDRFSAYATACAGCDRDACFVSPAG